MLGKVTEHIGTTAWIRGIPTKYFTSFLATWLFFGPISIQTETLSSKLEVRTPGCVACPGRISDPKVLQVGLQILSGEGFRGG